MAAVRLSPGLNGQTYVGLLQAMLAFDGRPLWFETLDDFTGSFLTVACPHCGEQLTIGPLFDGGQEVGRGAGGDVLLAGEVLPAPGHAFTAA
jgi:hypothetical protein